MGDFPEDVLAAAEDLIPEMGKEPGKTMRGSMVFYAARAIMQERERLEGVLARYIESVLNAEGTDFIDGGLHRDAGFIGPDEPTLFRCSGRNEQGRVTPEAEAITATIRARRP